MARMSLPLDLIVDITSTSVKDTFAIGKLNTLAIAKYDKNNPQPKFQEAHTLSDVISVYGLDSEVYGFASVYFGVISKSATRADTLYIYNWSKDDVAPFLNGAKIALLEDIQNLSGGFELSINGVTARVEVEFNSITSFSEAAEVLQAAVREAGIGLSAEQEKLFSETSVIYNPVTQGFTIVAGTQGDGTSISFAQPLSKQINEVTESINDINSFDNPLILKYDESYTFNFVGLPNDVTFKITYNDANAIEQYIPLTLIGNKLTITNDEITTLLKQGATDVELVINDPDSDNAGAAPREVKVSITLDESQVANIYNMLGLTQEEGATSEQGYNGLENISDVLADIEGNNGNYYVLTTTFAFDNVKEQLHEFGKFLHTSNDRFLGVYSWNNAAIVSTKGFLKEFHGYNGLVIDYQTMPYQQGLVCGYISAMELNNPSGNYNIAFNDATLFSGNALTETQQYQILTENKANAPCKFGILGQDDTIYMDGTCMGSKTNSINIYCANSFIKMNQQIALFNMFKSQKMIAVRGRQTQGVVRAYLDDVFSKAVKANIICRGATLTTTEIQMIKGTFVDYVDDLDELIRDIENNGYFYAVTNFDLVNKTMNIIEAYVANTPAKKIIVNIYILGA
ncbi:DUF3383 family protein [Helicobacter sp. MIT 05-5294]|uniref:DUF3383 family protein n=1 Tax=Helicobacter sp. MIT 05-5294 TaxID=1548150 RepID=UPI0010FF2FF3|nr:DUF3383 family protein [Helicobacter sp. MIT 05-5294]TLD85791.1 DUF3383 family protein [Helicobacter sp. MIT 05-5294]